MLKELLRCPAKEESWKRKRDDGEVEIEEGATTSEEVSGFLGDITKVVLRVPTTVPKVSAPTERIDMTPSMMMDVKVMKMALAVAPPALPIVKRDKEVHVAMLLAFVVSVEPFIIKVAEEEELAVIKAVARDLSATTMVLRDGVVGEAEVLIVVGLLVVEALANVLLATIKLLVGEATGETVGGAGAHGQVATPVVGWVT